MMVAPLCFSCYNRSSIPIATGVRTSNQHQHPGLAEHTKSSSRDCSEASPLGGTIARWGGLKHVN